MLTELLLFLILLLVVYSFIPSKPHGLPPGLWGWPLVGALPKQGISLMQQVKQLQKEYGDIISWRLGGRIMIFLCNYKVIKSVLSRAETSDRPYFYSFQSGTLFTGGGIINSSGLQWQNNRRFILQHLKKLGLGKTILEDSIQEEAAALLESFKTQVGSPRCLPWSINVAVSNVLWKMVAGVRYETDDPKIIELQKKSTELFRSIDGPGKWLDFFPWLIPIIPEYIKKWVGMTSIYEKTAKITSTFTEMIKEHSAKLDPEKPKDLIDAYLTEMKNQESNSNSHMSIQDLEIIVTDLFIAGSDTTSNTLRWALIYMAKYPKIQKKMQSEIDSVVPQDVRPSLHDRERLPYTDAVTYELHRIISLSSLGVPHYAAKDIDIDGYTIPKGSVLFAHLYCCNSDPAYWEKPEEFRPEHFLDDQEKLLRNKEGFAPFSLGRRSCIGESLAKMEFFIFLTTLLQKFTFSAPEEQKLSTERDPKEMFLHLPKDVPLVVHERH